MRTHLTKRTIAGGAAVLALLGAGGGIAAAASSDPEPPAGQSTQQTQQSQPDGQGKHAGKHGGKHGKGKLLRKVEHGQFTLGGKKGERTVLVQRGTVESFDGRTLKLKSKDGFEASYTVGDATKARKDGKQVELSEIKQGEQVGVVAEKSGDTATAKSIRETQPKQK